MKYKLIGNNDRNNIIRTVLCNRGVDQWSEYLNLHEIDNEEYKNLDNINKAVECFVFHAERGDDVGILFDTDT